MRTKYRKEKSSQLSNQVNSHQFAVQNDYYAVVHYKIKAELRHRQFKNALDMLFDMEPPSLQFLPLFYADQLNSISKLLRQLILRKDNSMDIFFRYFEKGKEILKQFYQLFLTHHQIQSTACEVKVSAKGFITRFLITLCSFLSQLLSLNVHFNIKTISNQTVRLFLVIIKKITTSSTASYRLLKRSSQVLLTLSNIFLYHQHAPQTSMNATQKSLQSAQASMWQQVFQLGIQNQTNILLLLDSRSKFLPNSFVKRGIIRTYNRLFVFVFNMAQLHLLSNKSHLSAFFFKECLLIEQLKSQFLQKETPTNISQCLANQILLNNKSQQISHIVSCYFNSKDLTTALPININQRLFTRQKVHSHEPASHPSVPSHKSTHSHKRFVKKSVSLQEPRHVRTDSLFSDTFNKETLFYGVKLFSKSEASKHKHFSQTPSKKVQKNQSKRQSKKSNVLVKNTLKKPLFNVAPLQFQDLSTKFQQTLTQDAKEVNKLHQDLCLLQYKNQNVQRSKLNLSNTNNLEALKIFSMKSVKDRVNKDRSKLKQSSICDNGINLFKNVMLKCHSLLGLRKTQTLVLLKRKVKKSCLQTALEYATAQNSVNFLQEKLANNTRGKQSEKGREDGHINSQFYSVFLTRDAVEIPNLFLSYITQTSTLTQILQVLLEFGLSLACSKS